jgi:neurofibromin 1
VVQDRFPSSVYTSIGGFIFLRFINPAIVSPETIDLDLPTDSREIRKGLVMITKVLQVSCHRVPSTIRLLTLPQALANNIRFGFMVIF